MKTAASAPTARSTATCWAVLMVTSRPARRSWSRTARSPRSRGCRRWRSRRSSVRASKSALLLAFWPADRPYLAGASAATIEAVRTVGFKARYPHAVRHIEDIEDFPGLGIDAAQVAFVVLPGCVPKIAFDPG